MKNGQCKLVKYEPKSQGSIWISTLPANLLEHHSHIYLRTLTQEFFFLFLSASKLFFFPSLHLFFSPPYIIFHLFNSFHRFSFPASRRVNSLHQSHRSHNKAGYYHPGRINNKLQLARTAGGLSLFLQN